MLRLCSKSLLNTCSKCQTLIDPCLIFISRKNSLVIQENKNKLEKPTCKYHHDSLDIYTDTLVMESMTKWKRVTFSTQNEVAKIKSNSVFKQCDDYDHLLTYLQKCLEGYCKVNKSVLTQFILTMARHGQINGLMIIEKLNDKYKYCIKKSELQMHFAEAYWVNGDLNSMFKLFDTLYLTESTKINHVLESIIYTIVKSHGSASIVLSSKFVKSIAINHGNYHPMCILWKYLFLSELFNDNLEAEILIRQNTNLIENVQYLVPIITNNMLKKHKVDTVQRLLMMLLKHNQIEQYQWILKSLFEYYRKCFVFTFIFIHFSIN